MKLWVTAGGTGSAWHICQIVKKHYADEIELFVSDINDAELVAASTLADNFFKVPPIRQEGYADYMYQLLQDNHIDVIIPLIPWEQPLFSPDREQFQKLGIRSLAPVMNTSRCLNDKTALSRFCETNAIPTIKIFSWQDMEKGHIKPESTYFAKAIDGFGAAGSRKILGKDITKDDFRNSVIQEYCGDEKGIQEITVEAFWNQGSLHTVARERLETKSGVCTKAKICQVPEAEQVISKMVGLLEFPMVFNVQFIRHEDIWKVMDVNLRLAAGTGLSCAAGFQLIRAALAALTGKEIKEEWFEINPGIKSILRVYQEVIIE